MTGRLAKFLPDGSLVYSSLGDDGSTDILEGKHRLFVFKKNRPYQKMLRARFERQKKEENWSDAFAKREQQRMKLRLRETSFWDVQPYALSGHVQMPDPFDVIANGKIKRVARRHGRATPYNKHVVFVHHPSHDFRIGVNVWCGHVFG